MAPMSLNLATEEGEENEHWSKKLWKLLNEGNTSIEIGVTLFIVISVIIITVIIVIRCKKKYRRPALPPIPQSKFFTNQGQQEQNASYKSDTLYDVINDSSKSHQAIKENEVFVCPDAKLLHVAITTTSSNSSSNNEYSKDPTSCLTSSCTSNDDSQNPTPYFPDRPVFEFDEGHPNSFAPEDLKKDDTFSHKCPQKTTDKYKALTLDRPRRKKRRGQQKSLDFRLSKNQADICNFYLPMTASKSFSIDELLHREAVKSDESLSEYVSHRNEVPVIVITTPDQDRDLYLLKNNI